MLPVTASAGSTGSTGSTGSVTQPLRVLLFSQRVAVRDAVRTAVGRRPARDLARIDWNECETIEAVLGHVDAGSVDLVVLDGESQPTGGMGIARQLKYEIRDCPPICVLLARQADRWLAHWSLADAALSFPLDALEAAATMARLLRERQRGVPVVRG